MRRAPRESQVASLRTIYYAVGASNADGDLSVYRAWQQLIRR